MKICSFCGNTIKSCSRATKYCSDECRRQVKYQKDRDWVKANPGKMNEYARKWRAKNPETVRQHGRDAYKRRCLRKLEEDMKSRSEK